MKKEEPSLYEKSFKMLALSFSSKLDWGSYIVCIAKTPSKQNGALIRSMKFISSEVALYVSLPYDLAWNNVIMSGLVIPVVIWIYCASYRNGYVGLFGPTFAASLEPLGHRQNVGPNSYLILLSPIYKSISTVTFRAQLNWNFFAFRMLLNDLKVTSTAKPLKMCHLRHWLRTLLFCRKVMFCSQDIQVFVFLTITRFTKSVTS